MRLLISVSDVAGDLLWVMFTSTQERKHRCRIITRLFGQFGKINTAGRNTRWRAGFQTINPEWQGT